ncbi:MAG TPA: F0F1 ATP synthase subunit alpha, partial [Terriglobales bacterium]|nr:F0F1 ATP synthase subunit alpha [Terriglobales bacterium]
MAISSDEISDVIKQRLRDFDAETVSADVGRVISVGDGIVQIFGLTGVMAGELIQFPGDVYGLALNLEEDQVRAVIMGAYEHIKEGDEVRTTGRIVQVPVGPALLGRTV